MKRHRGHRVDAWIGQVDDVSISPRARIVRSDDKVCVEAHAAFSVLGTERAAEAAGAASVTICGGFVR